MSKKTSKAVKAVESVEQDTPKKRGGARPGAGRKPSDEPSKMGTQVQFGRHLQEEIDLIDQAASIEGETRSGWVWPILMREAKRVIKKASQ